MVEEDFENYQLALVEWEDANAFSGWATLKDFEPELGKVRTVGWIKHIQNPPNKSEAFLVLYQSISTEGHFNGAIAIPTAWIQSIIALDQKSTRKSK